MTEHNPDDLVSDFGSNQTPPSGTSQGADTSDDETIKFDVPKKSPDTKEVTREHEPTKVLKPSAPLAAQPAPPGARPDLDSPVHSKTATRPSIKAIPQSEPKAKSSNRGLAILVGVVVLIAALAVGGVALMVILRPSGGISLALTASPTVTRTPIGAASQTPTVSVGVTVLPTGTVLPTASPSTPTAAFTPTSTDTPSPVPPTEPPVPTAIPTLNAATLAPSLAQNGGSFTQAGIAMIAIPGGTFKMGSDASAPEQPAHNVTLAPFYIDATEVTNAAWAACVAAGGCHQPGSTDSFDHKPYYGVDAFNNYPVVFVSWYSADAYCHWRGGRLPTEAEWEMSARWNAGSGTTSVYPWGDTWNPANLNACDASCLLNEFKDASYNDGRPQMSPVDAFPADASPLGVRDMAGNVAEWVADWYSPTYYAVSPAQNPPGPATGVQKVVRGGSWSLDKNWARGAARSHFGPLIQAAGIGLRCAVTATP